MIEVIEFIKLMQQATEGLFCCFFVPVGCSLAIGFLCDLFQEEEDDDEED